MFKSYGLISGLHNALPLAAPDPGPSNPANYLPTGPNFSLFGGLAPTSQLVIGTALSIVLFIGIFNFIKGLAKLQAKNRETGQGARGLGQIITGSIMVVGTFVLIPIINLVIAVAQSAGGQIK